MRKNLLSLLACAALATAGMVAPAAAQAANYYFYSICGVAPCPGGPGPVKFGPFTSVAQCVSAVNLTLPTFWGMYPRSLSTCFAA